MSENYFNELSGMAIKKEWIEERQSFSYLSWAFAQEILGNTHPEAIIEVKEYGENGFPYLQTPVGYFVQVIVEINGVKRGRPFAVTDSANRPLGADYWDKAKKGYVPNRHPSSFDINTSIQRAFVKACAEHGIGLYIYQGEDLPAAVTGNRKEEILTAFAQWRNENDKTDKWFMAKETILNEKMEDWSIDMLETYFKDLTEARAKAEAKRKAEETKQDDSPAEGEDSSDTPPEIDNKRQHQIEQIHGLCTKYEVVDNLTVEYTDKLKKESIETLTDKQLQTLYDMALRKEQTELKKVKE